MFFLHFFMSWRWTAAARLENAGLDEGLALPTCPDLNFTRKSPGLDRLLVVAVTCGWVSNQDLRRFAWFEVSVYPFAPCVCVLSSWSLLCWRWFSWWCGWIATLCCWRVAYPKATWHVFEIWNKGLLISGGMFYCCTWLLNIGVHRYSLCFV